MKDKKYSGWEEHPKWNELEQLCNQIEYLKQKAKELKGLIQKEVFGSEK